MQPIKWTEEAFLDLQRFYEFLLPFNAAAASKTIQTLTSAPEKIGNNPRLGERLLEFAPREVRRLIVGHYELRYEIRDNLIYILRIWHARENR